MAVTFLVFGANLYGTITHQNAISNDYATYSTFVAHMKSSGTVTTPHFIYPLLVVIASVFIPSLSYSVLGAGIVLLFQLLLAHVLWKLFKQMLPAHASDFIAIGLTLAAMTVAPITLLTVFQHNAYNGYIGITVYHNPPISICRPVALMNVLLVISAVVSRRFSARQMLFCFFTLALAALMKPNYALIMLPTAALFAILALFRKDVLLLRFLCLGVLLPGLLVLAWQYAFTYLQPPAHSDMDSASILFAPFLVYSTVARYLIPKFFLSILFPLGVLLLYRNEVLRNRSYMIGLVLFLMGAAQSYLFAEGGTRMFKGNFLWSGQLGLFFWFVLSLAFVLQRFFAEPARNRWSGTYLLLAGIFSLHVISGVIWYYHETLTPGAFW